MADLKLKLLVNLSAGLQMFKSGTVYEGTLDEFPEVVRATYLSGRPGRIEILVDAKGKEKVPMKPVTGTESAKVEQAEAKPVKDDSAGQTGKPVQGVTTDEKSLDGPSVISADAKGESGTDDKKAAVKKTVAKKKKPAAKRSPKAKPKLLKKK